MVPITYTALLRRAGRWLRRGHSVVLDATCGSPHERAAVRRLATTTGARLVTFVCDADEQVLRQRLVACEDANSGASDARQELWPHLRSAFVEPNEMPEAVPLATAGTPAEVVSRAIVVLGSA